jgi:hypothetical protein
MKYELVTHSDGFQFVRTAEDPYGEVIVRCETLDLEWVKVQDGDFWIDVRKKMESEGKIVSWLVPYPNVILTDSTQKKNECKKVKLFIVTGCFGDPGSKDPLRREQCPMLKGEHMFGGLAMNYSCRGALDPKGQPMSVVGYVESEWEKKKPGDFPSFCPLQEG